MNHTLNIEARDRLQAQISARMSDIHLVVRREIKEGLDYLEEARVSVCAEPADTVEALLTLASKKFDLNFAFDSESIANMAKVAKEIHEGEI